MAGIRFLDCAKRLPLTALVLALSLAAVARAEDKPGDNELLGKEAYRSELEEVVVVGRKPEWREQDKPEWRPQRFELPEDKSPARMEWMPEYTKDERDLYDGVRDRKNEKAEIKLFEWKF